MRKSWIHLKGMYAKQPEQGNYTIRAAECQKKYGEAFARKEIPAFRQRWTNITSPSAIEIGEE